MANTVSGTLKVSASYSISKPQDGAAATKAEGTNNTSCAIASTTTATSLGGGDLIYGPVVRTLTASSNETLDLSGSLSNLVGDTSIAFARVKMILVELLSAAQTTDDGVVGTAATSILVGGAASNQALAGSGKMLADTSDKVRVLNGGFFAWGAGTAAGVTVANASTDSLKVENEDGAVSAKYRITVWGASS